MKKAKYLIQETNPFPFMKRYHVYREGKWIAKFRYLGDAEMFCADRER